MAYTAPRTWTNGELIDASIMNTHVRDNIIYLKSQVSAHILFSGASIVPSNTNGCTPPTKIESATNKQNLMLPTFDYNTNQYGEWTLPYFPDDYNGGTVTAKFIWTHNAQSALGNSVVWGFQARAYADGDAIDGAWGTAQEVSDQPHASLTWLS